MPSSASSAATGEASAELGTAGTRPPPPPRSDGRLSLPALQKTAGLVLLCAYYSFVHTSRQEEKKKKMRTKVR